MDGRVVAVDLRRDNIPPMLKMHRIGHHQPHVPIDARPGIPARRRLLRIITSHRDHILILQMRREVISETGISIRPMPEHLSVDPHIAVGHHAVEIDEDVLVFRIRRKREMLAIPTNPRAQKRPRPASGASCSNGPSIAQSCGTSTRCHAPSSNSIFCASAGSPLLNRQSVSNACVAAWACVEMRRTIPRNIQLRRMLLLCYGLQNNKPTAMARSTRRPPRRIRLCRSRKSSALGQAGVGGFHLHPLNRSLD